MNPTDQELEQWARTQRRHYHQGTLKRSQISKLESLPGWTWDAQTTPGNEQNITDDYLLDTINAELKRLGVASIVRGNHTEVDGLDAVSVQKGIAHIADTENGWCNAVQFLDKLKTMTPRETTWKDGDRVHDGSWGDCWDAYEECEPMGEPEE